LKLPVRLGTAKVLQRVETLDSTTILPAAPGAHAQFEEPDEVETMP
jgi:hypothetical protein